MKTVKTMLEVIGIIVGCIVTIGVATALLLFGMQAFCRGFGVELTEEMQLSLGGRLGVCFGGVFVACYMKRKGYCNYAEKKETFQIGKAIIYGISAICICQVLFDTVAALLFSQLFPMTSDVMPETSFFADIVLGVVIAPVSEELLFRTGIYSFIRTKANKSSAIIISSLVFAALHMYNPVNFLSCLVAGTVFAIIYDKTGNIWYSIVAHAFCNLNAYVLNNLERQDVSLFGMPLQYEINGYNVFHIAIILMALVFCVAMYGNKLRMRLSNVSNIGCR